MHVRPLADRGDAACGQQNARQFKRTELERFEPGLVGHERQQRGRGLVGRAHAGDNVIAQPVGLQRNERDELVTGQRRRRGEDTEPEWDE